MTQNLSLQHSSELSTSPENTFVHQSNRKKSSSVTLLSMKDTTNSSSIDEPNDFPTETAIKTANKPIDRVIESMKHNSDDNIGTTDSCVCSDERIYYLNLSNKSNVNNRSTIYNEGGNSSACDSIENSVPLSNKHRCNGTSAIKNGYRDDNRTAGNYLIAVHRKMSRQDTYFLSYHKTRPSLFGVPLLIPCYEGGTNKDLYCAVWMQVARFLSPLPPTPPDQSNHATDW